jgi:hypothetical protein
MALPSKETLRLIQWLASRNEEQLLVLAKGRGLSAAQVGSLTAAATQLLDDRALAGILDALSRDALGALASLATDATPEGLAELSQLGLVDERETPALALVSPEQLASLASLTSKDKPPTLKGCPAWTEDALGKQATVVASVLCELGDVIDAAGTAGGDYRHLHGVCHGARNGEVVSGARSIAINGGEQYFPRTARHAFLRPRHGFEGRFLTPAFHPHFVHAMGIAFGVDTGHHALRPKAIGGFGE